MADTDLDPQAFLRSVRDLSDKRQREDSRSYEDLEAQVLRDRAARLERKLDRQRSLSPVKTPRSDNITTPVPDAAPSASTRASPTRELTKTDSVSSFRSDHAQPFAADPLVSPSKPSSPSSAMPSRANTLWQRRPQTGLATRPLSVFAAENAARASVESSPTQEKPDRQDIARTLASKDPSYFRQTPDRGIGSPAYQKMRGEEQDSPSSPMRRLLPGFSNDTKGASAQTTAHVETSRSPPLEIGGHTDGEHAASGATEEQSSSGRASTPEVQRAAFGRAVPSLQSRPSVSGRPASPTKGMGGFVESAMMKRTDSMSKRWSIQPAGLGRQDSSASLKGPLGSLRSPVGISNSMPRLDSTASDAEARSRPESDRGVDTLGDLPIRSGDTSTSPTRRHGSFHSRSKSHASLRDSKAPEADVPPTFSPPLASSRWRSPSKSSWLESALSRPQSPVKQISPQSTQPTWMADLSNAKQQRDSVATIASYDGTAADIGTATIQSYQAVRPANTASPPLNAGNAIEPSTSSELSKRNFTPPTKAKPAAYTSKPVTQTTFKTPNQSPLEPQEPFAPTSTTQVSSGQLSRDTKPSSETSKPLNGSAEKSKPETLSPTDFRANLKSRPASGEQSGSAEPEFRNAMGKLKRTTTQNYVAPDVLKNNILRGKANLAATDGPQKTARVDEFKESILHKKAEWKNTPTDHSIKPTQKPPLPAPKLEALEVKKGLARSDSNVKNSAPNARRDITPEALARHKTLRGKPDIKPGSKPSKLSDTPAAAPYPSKTSQIGQKASVVVQKPATSSSESATRAGKLTAELPANSTTGSSITSAGLTAKPSSFADRFNPALAGLLARGPPVQKPLQSEAGRTPDDTKLLPTLALASSTPTQEVGPGKELTHMTKDRARGPKRRKPKSSNAEQPDDSSSTPVNSSIATRDSAASATLSTLWKTPVGPRPKSNAVRTLSSNLSSTTGLVEKSGTPIKAATFPLVGPARQQADHSTSHSPTSGANTSTNHVVSPSSKFSHVVSSPSKTSALISSKARSLANQQDDNKENTDDAASVKKTASTWGATRFNDAVGSHQQSSKSLVPPNDEAVMRSAGVPAKSKINTNTTKPDALGITTSSRPASKSPISLSSPGSMPPKPIKSSRIASQTLTNGIELKDDRSSRTPRASTEATIKATNQLRGYFGSVPNISSALEVDAQSVLDGKSAESPIRTLRKTIHLLSDKGSLTPLPANREYVLFSASTYIVTHVSGIASGQRQTDVFLWAGQAVSDASIDNAQVTAKRIAKDVAGSLRMAPPITLIRQAKEPASFVQALGGIVVIRNGTHADTATKPYLLCGRPHAGHIAFDEVSLDAGLLYSAFPFILVRPTTIQDTQVFLWKGKGCSAETVGSARLIAMDLASSDIDEVSDGSEPAAFLSQLPTKTSRLSAGNLKLSDKLYPRLFRFDAPVPRRAGSSFFGLFGKAGIPSPRLSAATSRPTSSASSRSFTMSPREQEEEGIAVTEVQPFVSQADFEPEHIYLLDCITTVLVIPGPLLTTTATQPHPSEPSVERKMWEHLFVQACLFGNDYAMLAAGLQDRPSVPKVQVLLGGDLGRTAKILFRTWDESRGLWGAAGLMAGGKKGGPEEILDVAEVLDCCAR